MSSAYSEAKEQAARLKIIHQAHDFYTIQRDREGSFKDIQINKVKLVEKLMQLGFRRYDLNVADSKFIRVLNNTLQEVGEKQITDVFIRHVAELEPYTSTAENITITADKIIFKLFNNLETYFGKVLLNRMIDDRPINLKQDTKTEKYLFYRNCWLRVTATGYTMMDYRELDALVWKDQIIPRTFTVPDPQTSVFETFCLRIAGSQQRLDALMTLIGYNLHNVFSGKVKATILTDSRIGEDGEPNGRTGKGILCKALGYMLNSDMKNSTVYVAIPGKEYDPKNIHKHAACNLDTQLVHIEDIYNNYNIEYSYNDITEGLTVRKLFQSGFMIRAKLIFSTNKTILIQGESSRDRVFTFELADHYSANYDPYMEFRHWLFDDWDTAEWQRFDMFMVACITKYLACGLIITEQINYKIRELKDHTAEDFIKYMDDLFTPEGIPYTTRDMDGQTTSSTLSIYNGDPLSKKVLFEVFRLTNSDFNTAQFRQKTFTKWVRRYCSSKGKQLTETRSGGKDYFTFKW